MTLFPPSNWVESTIPVESGGCGNTHRRPYINGAPVHPYALECTGCEDHLRKTMGDQWSTTIAEIRETYDEKLVREDFEKRGAKDKDNLLAMAIAKLAGLELPDSMKRMITGLPSHVPGQLVCPNGHSAASGSRFCPECAAPLHGTPATAALNGGTADVQVTAGPKGRPPRLRDQNKKTLQALCTQHGLPGEGSNSDLVARLAAAGVTSSDLLKLQAAA